VLISDEMIAKYQKVRGKGRGHAGGCKATAENVRVELLQDKAVKWIRDNNERMMGRRSFAVFL
jgi:hypothetical protein